MRRRVVITGLGLCTPVGRSVDSFWRSLLSGRSGIGPVTLFDAGSLPVRIAGEVKGMALEPLEAAFPEAKGEQDRKIWLGLDAASQALADAGLGAEQLAESLLFVGVSLETFFLDEITIRGGPASVPLGLKVLELAKRDAGAPWAQRQSPRPLQTALDRLAELLGDRYGMSQGRYTNCSACAAGAQAIGEAFRRLRDGSVDLALAGAADSVLNPLGLGGFSLLNILSNENEEPQRACRPFDVTRQGTVLAEGAAFLVLETLEHADRRGARAYAEVAGYGSSLDAFRVTDPEPNGRGAVLSMTRAIKDAGLQPQDIDCVNAHGTGTPKNDVTETLAIKRVLGSRAGAVPVTANKSMTGHMIAASGAVEAAASALTLFAGKVPPTINLACPDPRCDLDHVAHLSREFSGRTVLSNSFGFGGQNATLVLRTVDS
jgi:3-oxoacyl-[acyl-carrier-protein] synthase II